MEKLGLTEYFEKGLLKDYNSIKQVCTSLATVHMSHSVSLWRATEFNEFLTQIAKYGCSDKIFSIINAIFSMFPETLLNTTLHNIGQSFHQSNVIIILQCLFLIILWPIKVSWVMSQGIEKTEH